MKNEPKAESWSRHPVDTFLRIEELQRAGQRLDAELLYADLERTTDNDLGGEARGRLRLERAHNLTALGRYLEAERSYREAQQLADEQADSRDARLLRVEIRAHRASNLGTADRHEDAETLFREALSILESLPTTRRSRNRYGLLMNRAFQLYELNRHTEAEPIFVEAQTGFDTLPDSPRVCEARAIVRMNRGINFRSMGRHEEAIDSTRAAEHLFDALPDSSDALANRARTRINRASMLSMLGQHAPAEELFARAQEIYAVVTDSLPTRPHRARLHLNRAVNLMCLGQYAQAESQFAAGQKVLDALPDVEDLCPDRIRLYAKRGETLHVLRHFELAEEQFGRAQALADTRPDCEESRTERIRIRLNRAANLDCLGRSEHARRALGEVEVIFDSLHVSERMRLREVWANSEFTRRAAAQEQQASQEAHVENPARAYRPLSEDEMASARLAVGRMQQADGLQGMGYHREAEALYCESQDAADTLPDWPIVRQLRADVRMRRASNCTALGNGSRAQDLLRGAQHLFDTMGDSEIMRINGALARFNRAQCLLSEGYPDAAGKLLAESQRILATVGDSQRVHLERTRVLGVRAEVLASMGQRQAAEELFARAQAELAARSDREATRECYSILLFNRANNLREIGRNEDALALLEEAEANQRDLFDCTRSAPIGRAIRGSQAALLGSMGHHDDSERLFAELHVELEALPASHAVTLEKALAYLNHASSLFQSGSQQDQVETLYAKAQSLLETLPDSPKVRGYRVVTLNNRAVNLRALGLCYEAEKLFCDVDAIEETAPCAESSRWHQAVAVLNRSENLRDLHLFEQATVYAVKARELFDLMEDTAVTRVFRARARRALGGCLHSLGRWREADTMYSDAQALCDELPESHEVTHEHAQLSEIRAIRLAEKGEYQDAMRLFDKAESAFKSLPDCDRTRCSIAHLCSNRAVGLTNMGRFDEAERAFTEVQAYFDRVRPSRSTQLNRAHMRSKRATNLMQMGHRELALELHAAAQAIYDSLPDSADLGEYRMKERVARATSLLQIGQFSRADELYGEARRLLDILPDRDSARLDRAIFFRNHSCALSANGNHAAAEGLLAESQRILDALENRESTGFHRASTLISRAMNCRRLCRYDEASALIDSAQSLFDAQPDSDAVRSQRALARIERCCILLRLQSPERAFVVWQQARDLLSTLRDASGVLPVDIARRLGSSLFDVFATGWLSDAECGCESASLAEWLLDRTDLAELGAVAHEAASKLQAFFGEYLNWLIDAGHLERVPEVLSAMFGRYAAAEFNSKHETGGKLSSPMERLAIRIRGFNSEIGRLEADADLLSRSSEVRKRVEQLYDEREAACREFRTLRRVAVIDDALGVRLAPIPFARVATAVNRCGRTLVILFTIRTRLNEVDRASEITRARAVAFIARPGMSQPAIVVLPPEVLTAADPPYDADVTGTVRPLRSRCRPGAAPPSGQMLREAVKKGWAAILPELSNADRLYVATHQELSHLPWPAGLPAAQAASMRMFHGVTLAVRALEHDAWAPDVLAPPSQEEPLVLLAHSPGARSEQPDSTADDPWSTPIPCVYGDCEVTTRCWADSHRIVVDPEELIATRARLIQISSHGDAFSLYTGPEDRFLSAFELTHALDRVVGGGDPPLRILITVACSTSQAATNILGESGGWSAMLQGRVGAVLGALYPVDDLFCTLWLLLLHRMWRSCGDLRAAVAHVREQMRSGQWAESETEGRELQTLWAEGLRAAATHAQDEGIPATRLDFADDPDALAEHYYRLRHRLYQDEPRFQAVTEAFVIFG